MQIQVAPNKFVAPFQFWWLKLKHANQQLFANGL